MAGKITLPKLSDTMEEGTILKWFKEEGDYVQKGETLFEVETDKAVMEVEAFSSGVLSSILVPAGEKVPVGTPIAVIGDEGQESADGQSSEPKKEGAEDEEAAEPEEEKPVDEKPTAAEKKGVEDEQPPEPKGKEAEDEKAAEPEEEKPVDEKPTAAEKKGAEDEQPPEPKGKEAEDEQSSQPKEQKAEDEEAAEPKEKGVADKEKAKIETKIQKSKPKAGKKKRLSKKKKDQEGTVQKEVNASPAAKSYAQQRDVNLAQITGTGRNGMITLSDVRNYKESMGESEPSPPSLKREMRPEEEITELSNMRKAIASTVSYSKQHIPHFYVTYEIDMSGMLAQLEQVTQSDNEKFTVNDVIVRAVAATLKDYPYLNAIYPEQGLIVKKEINIGVVMGLPDGLVIPVLKNCDNLTLKEISSGIRRLREKAEAGRFSQADFTDGTFSISNLGMLGVTDFAAIIYPPQTGILAVSGIKDTPVSKEGNIVTVALMKVTLSVDHRVVDGVTAANFLRNLKKYLETEKLTAMEKPCCTIDDD